MSGYTIGDRVAVRWQGELFAATVICIHKAEGACDVAYEIDDSVGVFLTVEEHGLKLLPDRPEEAEAGGASGRTGDDHNDGNGDTNEVVRKRPRQLDKGGGNGRRAVPVAAGGMTAAQELRREFGRGEEKKVAGRLNAVPAPSTPTPFIKSQVQLPARIQDMAPTGRPMTDAAALVGSGSQTSYGGNTNVLGTRDFSPIGQTWDLSGAPTTLYPLALVQSALVQSALVVHPALMGPARARARARLPRKRGDSGPTHARPESDVVYCTAQYVIGPDGPRSAVKINGKYTSWVLELGIKQRNLVIKSLNLSQSEKEAYVAEAQKHKHRIRQLAYVKRNIRPGDGSELIP